jgi:hypothetical protein
VTLALAAPLLAQTSSAGRLLDPEARLRALRELSNTPRATPLPDANVERRQIELNRRLIAFAQSWNKLIHSVHQGSWDARAAKKARQAFRKLMATPGWIEATEDLSVPRTSAGE